MKMGTRDTQGVFASFQLLPGYEGFWLPGEQRRATQVVWDEFFKNVVDLKNDPEKQRFIENETGINFKERFAALEKTHMVFGYNPGDINTSECGLCENWNSRYASVMLGSDTVKNTPPEKLLSIIGHEVGHVSKYMIKHKNKIDEAIRNKQFPSDEPDIRNPANEFTVLSLYHPLNKYTDENWENERDADTFNRAVNPSSANIGHVLSNRAPLNNLFMNDKIGLQIALFLGNMCDMRNKFILKHENKIPKTKSVKKLMKDFKMTVDNLHPTPIGRSAADAVLKQKIDRFEQKRR